MPDEIPDRVRDATAIARRAIALSAVVGVALEVPRDKTIAWLKEQLLWDELTPWESEFLAASQPTQRQLANASWRCEAVLVLLWALGKIEPMPPANEQCEPGDLQEFLPPFASVSVNQFIGSASRRPDQVLLDMADAILDLNWEARDARIHERPDPPHVDQEVIQERHHAINWIVGYQGLPWDDVATDT